MDPAAALEMAVYCWITGRRDDAILHLKDYRDWREKGGFDPIFMPAGGRSSSEIDGKYIAAMLTTILGVPR